MNAQSQLSVAAILAEVLTVRSFRRWLVAQGDRVFPYADGGVTCFGLYVEEVSGLSSDAWDYELDHKDWIRVLFDWLCLLQRDYTAAEVAIKLDSIVAALAGKDKPA